MNSAEDLKRDELARELATDPQLSILLQAPAGSGKTTVLTQRLLRLLATVDEPEQILAITFTRKAAAEMRSRVLKALRDPIADDAPDAVRLRAAVAAVREHSERKGWNLLENPGRLRIQTIDSFNYWLASQLPVAAKAGGTLTVAERPFELYQRAARETLQYGDHHDDLRADIQLLFERTDNNWGRTERLIAEMLDKRGHWLRYVTRQSPETLRKRIHDSLQQIAAEHLARACERLPQALRREMQRLVGVPSLGPAAEDFGHWQKVAQLLLVKDRKRDWRKAFPRSPANGGPCGDDLRQCVELLRGVPEARETLAELSLLPSPALGEADAAAIEALSRILKTAAGFLQIEFAAHGRVDYTYIGGAARQALTEGGLPTDLALRTGLSLRHILVDEFQDTSIAQFELLEALTAGWEEGDGRTLFVVGDPMQSIYQFREAEVGLFLRARDRGIGNVRLRPLQLVRNFRSTASLISEINQTFGQLFPPEDDLRASAVTFTPSVAARGISEQRPMELLLHGPDDRAGEAAGIAQRILELRQQNAKASIAVLVAARTHAPQIMAALADAGIAAIGVDLVALAELPVIRDLAALMRALHNLADRVSWLTILRAPWCGLTLASLTVLSTHKDELLPWEALWDEGRVSACSEGERRRILRVREILSVALATRGQSSLAEWLETTWIRLGAPDCYSAHDLCQARTFFGLLAERAAAGEWQGPADLDALLKDLFAEPPGGDPDAVQVMTIHRAKGLEFDHVFLPALDRERNRGMEPLLRWLDLPRSEDGSDLLMAPMPAIGGDDGDELNRYLKHLMGVRESHEQIRLLYVAATRARETLHLSAAPKVRKDGTILPRAGTLLSYLWPALGHAFAIAGEGTTLSLPLTQLSHPLRRLRADWEPHAVPEAATYSRLPLAHRSLEPVEFSWVGETARHIGTVVHRALERYGRTGQLPDPSVLRTQRDTFEYQLRRLGVPERDLSDAVHVVTEALARTFQDERGRWIFDPGHRDAHSELALTGLAGGVLANVIIDRAFVDRDGTRWLIDFKTSRHEGGSLDAFIAREAERYRPQLARYAELMRAFAPEPVRTALYFPFLGVFREITDLRS